MTDGIINRDVLKICFIFVFGRIAAIICLFVFVLKYEYFEYEYLAIVHLLYTVS